MKIWIVFLLVLICTACADGSDRGAVESAVHVVHAGGMLWARDSGGVYRSFPGSNSREGLTACADKGARFAELDFSFTADGELVCIHGWDNEYIAEIGDGTALTAEEFRSSKIYGCFTPMTLYDAAEIIRKNEGLTLVADIKADFYDAAALIAEAFSDMPDRVVIQIYREDQYGYAAGLGFSRIAYTLYELPWDEKLDADAHIAFAQEHDLEWIAFSDELCENTVFMEKMKEAASPLYVHTVNDEKTEKYVLDMGISGVYTDHIK